MKKDRTLLSVLDIHRVNTDKYDEIMVQDKYMGKCN